MKVREKEFPKYGLGSNPKFWTKKSGFSPVANGETLKDFKRKKLQNQHCDLDVESGIETKDELERGRGVRKNRLFLYHRLKLTGIQVIVGI